MAERMERGCDWNCGWTWTGLQTLSTCVTLRWLSFNIFDIETIIRKARGFAVDFPQGIQMQDLIIFKSL